MSHEELIALCRELQKAWLDFDLDKIAPIIATLEANEFIVVKDGNKITITNFITEIEIERTS